MSEQTLKIHLDRIVGFVIRRQCRWLPSVESVRGLARSPEPENDSRDEDRDGIAGYDSKAACPCARCQDGPRNRSSAVSQGVIHAYAEIVGMDWKPYTPNAPRSQSLTQRSAKAELDAFKA